MAGLRMPSATLQCSNCQNPLPPGLLNQPGLSSCPACRSSFQAVVFPAWLHPPTPGAQAETILVEGEAGCFYHPDKRAVVPCHRCGRFLCALCDVALGDEHLCLACLEAGQAKGTLAALDQRRILYDSTALLVAVVPLVIMWPATVVTGPAAMVVAIYSFKKPNALVPRRRWRAYLALVLGGLQAAGWIWIGVLAWRGLLN